MASKRSRPRILILSTGGTIAGTAAEARPGGYTAGTLSMDAMLDAIPGIREIADLDWVQVAGGGSQDMTFSRMQDLADRINTVLDAGDTAAGVDGVVVTHGTDTLEETAYFLNLRVRSPKPVVLTGAMRPFFATSADGPQNLFGAVAVAADPRAADRGVLVVMNNQIHGARSLQKNHTLDVAAFTSGTHGLIGEIQGHDIRGSDIRYFRRPFRTHTYQSEFSVPGALTLPFPRVDIVYACADMPADLIDGAVARGAKGIVIAGVGNGNMSKAALDRAAVSVKNDGIAVVRSSRVPAGRVIRNLEVDDDRLGFVVADDLSPAKARILLMLALMKKRGCDEIQRLFDTC